MPPVDTFWGKGFLTTVERTESPDRKKIQRRQLWRVAGRCSPSQAGLASADGVQRSRVRTWRGERRREGKEQVTEIPAAPTSTHSVSISSLPGRLGESRAVTCPGVQGTWNLSPLLSVRVLWSPVVTVIQSSQGSSMSWITQHQPAQFPLLTHQEPSGRCCHWTPLGLSSGSWSASVKVTG